MNNQDFQPEATPSVIDPDRLPYESPQLETLSHGEYMALLGSGAACANPAINGPAIDGCDLTA